MVLSAEMYGKIRFQTVEQVWRFRDLGNRLYQALPHPVLRGWKPYNIENAPRLHDDNPERDEDIPDGRPEKDKLMETLSRYLSDEQPKPLKIGRNDPCPRGSGLKYKKCRCEKYHKV